MRLTGVVVALLLAVPVVSARRQAAPIARETLLLAVDRMLEARWYPPDPSARSGPSDDALLLRAALGSSDELTRALAVRSVGRFENPLDIPTLAPFLRDASVDVRREALNALVMAANAGTPEDIANAASIISIGGSAMRITVKPVPPSPPQSGTTDPVQEALASLHYGTSFPSSVMRTGPRWLAYLASREPALVLDPGTLRDTHAIALGAKTGAKPNADALMLLLRQRDVNASELWNIIRYRCMKDLQIPVAGGCGWQARLVTASLADPVDPALEPILQALRIDPVFQVRIAALRSFARLIPFNKQCAPLLEALTDGHEPPIVQIEATALVVPACQEREAITTALTDLARDFKDDTGDPRWPLGIHALDALAEFDPQIATQIVQDQAAASDVWQVRAAAARTAARVRNEEILLRLAHDAVTNVVSDALDGLRSIGSAQRIDIALAALDSRDYRLVSAGADALSGAPDPDRTSAALIRALKRVTAEGKDTSRQTRLRILERLMEFGKPTTAGGSRLATDAEGLRAYLEDFDPVVADAAATLIGVINGTPPPATRPHHRPPQQPRAIDLVGLPNRARMLLSNGDRIEFELLPLEAPLTVARFVMLTDARYYDNTVFHRVTGLLAAQGGSPGANDSVSDGRFLRDEIGLEHHTRGTLAMATSGRDTGAMQFFIDLLDQPTFDHQFTIFGRVRSRWDALDRILEGARIQEIRTFRE